MIIATHYTDPWYVAVPILVVAIGAKVWQSRRGGGRGPDGGGPFDGWGDGH
jgi:hypothetical protein